MKKWLTALAILAFQLLQAQADYPPAPPPAPNLAGGEYFIGTDPGIGLATPFALGAQSNLTNWVSSLNIASAPPGFTSIGFRTRDANGLWSLTTIRPFLKLDVPGYGTASARPEVVAAEYWFNNDPGIGLATRLSLVPAADGGPQAALIDISTLPAGFYSLGMRTLDANGRWSLATFRPFVKSDLTDYPLAPPARPNVVAAEYWITTDPGIGMATPLTLIPAVDGGSQNAIVDISGLPVGIYVLGIRTRDANGQWSLTQLRSFNNSTPAAYPAAPPAAAPLQQMEYFIDNDPGFGLATPITFSPSTQIVDLNVPISLTGLSDGQHTLCIRSRNNPWSLTTIAEFVLGDPLPLRWLYVKGELKNDGAHLQWGTATEINTADFVVEQSVDGRQFKALGTVPAWGNSNANRSYSYLHANPAAGLNYYRIRQNDRDGTFTYSKTITLLNRSDLKKALMVPNPASSMAVMVLPSALGADGVLQIIDASGKQVLRKPVSKGAIQVNVELQSLPVGSYRAVLTSEGYKEVLPFVKQ